MKHLNMAQEATRTEHGRATAEWIAERSRRAVEHYATEGFGENPLGAELFRTWIPPHPTSSSRLRRWPTPPA